MHLGVTGRQKISLRLLISAADGGSNRNEVTMTTGLLYGLLLLMVETCSHKGAALCSSDCVIGAEAVLYKSSDSYTGYFCTVDKTDRSGLLIIFDRAAPPAA